MLSIIKILSFSFSKGFGDDLLKEEKTIESLVNTLKNDIKYIHLFVIAFRQQDNRSSGPLCIIKHHSL